MKLSHNSEKMKENAVDIDPEDIPINVSYSRNQVSDKLQSLNVSFAKNTSTERSNKTFESKLKQTHPIHQYLK